MTNQSLLQTEKITQNTHKLPNGGQKCGQSWVIFLCLHSCACHWPLALWPLTLSGFKSLQHGRETLDSSCSRCQNITQSSAELRWRHTVPIRARTIRDMGLSLNTTNKAKFDKHIIYSQNIHSAFYIRVQVGKLELTVKVRAWSLFVPHVHLWHCDISFLFHVENSL